MKCPKCGTGELRYIQAYEAESFGIIGDTGIVDEMEEGDGQGTEERVECWTCRAEFNFSSEIVDGKILVSELELK